MSDGTTTSPWGEPPAAYIEPTAEEKAQAGTDGTHHEMADAAYIRYHPPVREVGLRRIFRITRATLGLAVIALGLGLVLAATLGAVVWAIATAIHHAASA